MRAQHNGEVFSSGNLLATAFKLLTKSLLPSSVPLEIERVAAEEVKGLKEEHYIGQEKNDHRV